MSPRHSDLAGLCAALYDSLEGWDHLSQIGDVVVAHKRVGDTDCVIFRGSQTTEDWLRDLAALPLTYTAHLGFVHGGFYRYMAEALIEVLGWKLAAPRLVLTGHSLGGARALILAAQIAALLPEVPVAEVVTFGAPRPGFFKLTKLARTWPVTEYRNCRDPVPTVPVVIPIIFPFSSVVARTEVNQPSVESDARPFQDHRIRLYQQGVTLLEAAR